MGEIVGAFCGREFGEDLPDSVADGVPGSFACGSEQDLDFGEGHLDGVQVGRIGRQVKQTGAAVCDRLAHALYLVAGKVVGDDDIAFAEGRGEHVADINEEGLAIHRPI